ncbi:MAG: ribosomal L7Ae/L30e/S12e/Gadd45 family protein [Lachnospiraceae bacterium]|nr:ribosomal L7Ae/L30e/S12e/Gadd45 family protein [Lachnospiraceae bacterium]
MRNDRVLSLLGLAAKAGKVVSGDFSTLEAIKSRKAFLVILAEDASKNTAKKFGDKTSYYRVPLIRYATVETLAHAIGKDMRSVAALTDQGFADAIRSVVSVEEMYGEDADFETDKGIKGQGCGGHE